VRNILGAGVYATLAEVSYVMRIQAQNRVMRREIFGNIGYWVDAIY
jgi:hypothetical protein